MCCFKHYKSTRRHQIIRLSITDWNRTIMFMNWFQADLRVRHNHVDALEQGNVGHFCILNSWKENCLTDECYQFYWSLNLSSNVIHALKCHAQKKSFMFCVHSSHFKLTYAELSDHWAVTDNSVYNMTVSYQDFIDKSLMTSALMAPDDQETCKLR